MTRVATSGGARFLAALACAAGCYTGAGPGGSGSEDGSTTAGDGSAEHDGSDDTAGNDGGDEDEACAGGTVAPLRRLTSLEYRNTVLAVLGYDAVELLQGMPDDGTEDGFANAAAVLVSSVPHAARYESMAETIADAITTAPGRLDLVGCDPASDADGCVRDFARTVMRRGYRRTPQEAAVTSVVELSAAAAEPGDAWDRIRIVTEVVLQSPEFLFRIERGEPTPDGESVRLDGPSVASRLSYLLTAAPPDDWLLDMADNGELEDVQAIQSAAERLFDDPRHDEAMQWYAAQWLRLAELDKVSFDPERFPEFDDAVRASARSELEALAGDALEGDLRDLYVGRHGYADADLAAIYDLPAGEDGLEPVDWEGEPSRGGLFATAGFAMMTSSWAGSSPVHRGIYVREVALCDPPPPPPPDVELPVPGEDETPADAQAKHIEDPLCASCHELIDPIGLGLERYDAIGRLRAEDEFGKPVSLEGEVVGLDPSTFAGGPELGALVASSDDATACFSQKLFRFAYGRHEENADDCAIDSLVAALAPSEYSLHEALLELVSLEGFRLRRVEDAP